MPYGRIGRGGVAVAGSRSTQRADEIRDVTRRRIEIFRDAGDDWPFAASLKSITEDTAQERRQVLGGLISEYYRAA